MISTQQLATNPATHTFSTRLDIRHLATVAKFWTDSRGERLRSTSELIRLTLEAFSTLLQEQGMVEFFSSLNAAEDYLSLLGLTKGVAQPRNIQNLGISLSLANPDDGIATSVARTLNQGASGHMDKVEMHTALAALENTLLSPQHNQALQDNARTREGFTKAMEDLTK